MKPSAVIGVTGGKLTQLYLGEDAEKATNIRKKARGSFETIWFSLNGRQWSRWTGKVESAPVVPPVEKPRSSRARARA